MTWGSKCSWWHHAAVHARSPPLSIVRRFIHLLEQSQHDFWEESEVLRLQEELVKRIRASRQLESDLDLMDIKIGLLVKNRITLQVGKDLGHLMWLCLGAEAVQPAQSWSSSPWHQLELLLLLPFAFRAVEGAEEY